MEGTETTGPDLKSVFCHIRPVIDRLGVLGKETTIEKIDEWVKKGNGHHVLIVILDLAKITSIEGGLRQKTKIELIRINFREGESVIAGQIVLKEDIMTKIDVKSLQELWHQKEIDLIVENLDLPINPLKREI